MPSNSQHTGQHKQEHDKKSQLSLFIGTQSTKEEMEKGDISEHENLRSLITDPQIDCLEVDSFPTRHIDAGATFTFTRETSNKVRKYSHGLHVYPAKFIPQIPDWSFEYANLKIGDTVLDPFCGSGTTLVEGLANGFNVFGCDINPLAALLSQAKTTPLYTNDLKQLYEDVDNLIKYIESDTSVIDLKGGDYLENLHPNWEFWFPYKIKEQLLKIRKGISHFELPNKALKKADINAIRAFYLACFSSIIKRCSYFDEREIKVRKDRRKTEASFPDPIRLLDSTIKQNLIGLTELARQLDKVGTPAAKFIGNKAQQISLADNSIDLITTSPPYLNAIDYAMAHKYSLFILGLVLPSSFKDHCRDYIGVTERAVRRQEYEDIELTGFDEIDETITKLKSSNLAVDKIRAYIVSEYFIDMHKALSECYRVLKPGSLCVVVVGDNTIRKQFLPTSLYLQQIAISKSVGFELETYFFHQLRNIRLKVKRNTTGGLIKKERIIVLRKP